jgi:hypothetical protein
MRVRYIWVPVLIAVISVPVGFYYVNWSKGGSGAGLYSRQWLPDAVFAYWNPDDFYQSTDSVVGEFEGEQCIACHEAVTPGIVKDWQASRHANPGNGKATVYCSDCHGNNHQALYLPAPDVCGTCHATQHAQFEDEKRYGFPSHALAMERVLDAKHFVDKPKAEVTACLQCHSVASKCDSCHTRHLFNAAEARRPEACITCHSGPPHPDDETYFASAHGQLYLAEGKDWDWSKPLRKGNYKGPTCAYCHMGDGKHQVADKSIWKFGIKEVNPLTSGNEVKREQWVALCSDCHEADWSRQQLAGLDAERSIPLPENVHLILPTGWTVSGRVHVSVFLRGRHRPSTMFHPLSVITSRCGTSITWVPTRAQPTVIRMPLPAGMRPWSMTWRRLKRRQRGCEAWLGTNNRSNTSGPILQNSGRPVTTQISTGSRTDAQAVLCMADWFCQHVYC